MATSKQLHILATNPQARARWAQTGKLPQGVRPSSPLISLLQALSPRDRMALCGLQVDSRLGYTSTRPFANAEQALKWLAPADEVFGTFPAESWRDKRFNQPLHLEDLLACCSRAPEGLLQRYPRLCRPGPAPKPPAP